MKNRIFSVAKFLIGWPLSLVALFFIVKLILPQAPQFLSRLDEISPVLLFWGIFCFLVYFFLRGYIWKRLVQQAGYNLSYKDTNFIWASSELQRYIPGNIWSFLGRTVMLHEKGMTKKDIAKCTLFEIELLTLGAAIVPFLSLPFLTYYFNFPTYLSPLAFGILFILIVFFIFHRKLNIKLFFLPDYPPVELLFLILLNAILFLFFGLGYFFTFASFIPINPNLIWQITGISVLAYLIGYLSLITPSGIGVREGALVLALSKIMSTSAAGFVALFGRFMLMFAEVLFVVLSYLWDKTRNRYITKIEHWIYHHKHLTVLSLLVIFYNAYFTTVTFLRYDNLYTGKFDLGNMSQTVWNTLHGKIFMFTNPNGTEFISRLSAHADFILILLAPFYALWPDPKNLLFIQTVILAAGAFFVYFIAKEVLKNKNIALVLAFAYLINSNVQRTNLYDFHAVTLATTFFLGAFLFFIQKRYRLFLLFAILAGICKEQLWLIIALFGPFLFFWHKQRLFGITTFVISIFFTFFLINTAIPSALGSQHFALSYFSEFGDSPLSIVKNILFSPVQTINTILQPDRIDYLKQIFYPLGYLSLLAPIFLIFALPDLAINLLSSNAHLHQIYYQYTATITPFLFIAAIYGIKYFKTVMLNLFQHLKRSRNITGTRFASQFGMTIDVIIIIYLVLISLQSAYLYGPLPGAKDANLDMLTKPVKDINFIDQALSKIPPNARVAASNNIASHLTNREYLYILPLGIDQADYIVFYLTPSQSAESLATDQQLVQKLINDPSFELVTKKGILIIFKKVYAQS